MLGVLYKYLMQYIEKLNEPYFKFHEVAQTNPAQAKLPS